MVLRAGWTSSELLARRGGQLMVLRVRADGVHLEPLMDRLTSGDHFAVRRLRSEASPAFVRELVEEIAAVAPLRWPQLLEPPRASATSLPIFTSVLRRALELSRAGLQAAAGPGRGSDTSLTEALGAADPAEALGVLNAAFVVAVYERLGVVSCTDSSIRLSPTSLATVVSEDYDHISLEALGPEMRLDVSKECES